MKCKTSPISTKAHSLRLVLLCSVFAVGCAAPKTNPSFSLRYEEGWSINDVDGLLPRSGDAPVAVASLGRTAWVSHHMAVVRTAEEPHYHRFHDLTVTVLRGHGVLHVNTRSVAMSAGDVAHVHRGTPHWFENKGEDAAVAFVSFSPPYDGRDRVTIVPDAASEAGAETGASEGEE